MIRLLIDWYHLYLNYPRGVIIDNKIQKVYYWKGFVTQDDLSVNMCNLYK